MEVFWAAPPVSRTLTAAILTTSVLFYAHIIPARWLVLLWPRMFRFPPEIWRLFTSFLITGPGMGIIFDTFFIYNYGSGLETNSPRFKRTSDFVMYVAFIWATLLILCSQVFGRVVFTEAFVLALAYTYSQENRQRKASFFIVTIPMQFLPGAILLLTLVTVGPEVALYQASGIAAGHLYDFLTRIWPTFGNGRNYLQPPLFLQRLVDKPGRVTSGRSYGTAFTNRPASQPPSGSSTGFAGFASGLWSNRGSGRRLGGD